jgi:hypothetical protein
VMEWSGAGSPRVESPRDNMNVQGAWENGMGQNGRASTVKNEKRILTSIFVVARGMAASAAHMVTDM